MCFSSTLPDGPAFHAYIIYCQNFILCYSKVVEWNDVYLQCISQQLIPLCMVKTVHVYMYRIVPYLPGAQFRVLCNLTCFSETIFAFREILLLDAIQEKVSRRLIFCGFKPSRGKRENYAFRKYGALYGNRLGGESHTHFLEHIFSADP